MNLSTIPRYLSTLSNNPRIFFGPKKYLFLVSHMRSFSTLLSHILGSSSDINGYRENHISYQGSMDLLKLRYRTQMAIEGKLDGTYVLDKILHNHWAINNSIIQKPNLKLLFTMRKPEDTVKSIINMGQKLVDEDWYLDHQKVANYYEGRLKAMATYANMIGKNAAYFDAEELIENPESLTEKLTHWLQLSDPLKTEYKQFRDTGKPIHGDPSSNILKGKILKDKRKYEIDLSRELVQILEQVYHDTRNSLLDKCTVLNS